MYRVGAAGTRDLYDHDYDRRRHADVVERVYQRVVHRHEVERAYAAGEDQQQGIYALHSYIEHTAQRGYYCLRQHNAVEEHLAPEVALYRIAGQVFGISHRHLYHRRGQERADKQRQHYVVRSHCRAVILYLVYDHRVQFDRGREIIGETVGVVFEYLNQLVEGLAAGEAPNVVGYLLEIYPHSVRQRDGIRKRTLHAADGVAVAADGLRNSEHPARVIIQHIAHGGEHGLGVSGMLLKEAVERVVNCYRRGVKSLPHSVENVQHLIHRAGAGLNEVI